MCEREIIYYLYIVETTFSSYVYYSYERPFNGFGYIILQDLVKNLCQHLREVFLKIGKNMLINIWKFVKRMLSCMGMYVLLLVYSLFHDVVGLPLHNILSIVDIFSGSTLYNHVLGLPMVFCLQL